MERDLRRHYRGDYRIVKAGSGREALDAVRQLQERGDQIALFLVDQRMPDMTDTDFLAQARKHFPDTRKVLLTAYADTQSGRGLCAQAAGPAQSPGAIPRPNPWPTCTPS